MVDVRNLISKTLHARVAVLLRGEFGTGKFLAAQAIHKYGERRHRAFVMQKCSGVSENALQQILFGRRIENLINEPHDLPCLMDLAEGGTLVLQDIGDLPSSTQDLLMNVLQESATHPYGSAKGQKMDVRIIATTHHDLGQKVAEGRFSEDLFYQLSHFPIELPPLRSRGQDVLEIARALAIEACGAMHRTACTWSGHAIDQLLKYSFPGNIPELKAIVERAVMLCDGDELLPVHFEFPAGMHTEVPRTLRQRMDELERGVLLESLQRNRGNRTRTACELGIARRTLLYRLERLQLARAGVQGPESSR